jgi:hypothetical protein
MEHIKVHYRVHNSPPLFPILIQINSVHAFQSYLLKIHFNIIHPCKPRFSSGLFPSRFAKKTVKFHEDKMKSSNKDNNNKNTNICINRNLSNIKIGLLAYFQEYNLTRNKIKKYICLCMSSPWLIFLHSTDHVRNHTNRHPKCHFLSPNLHILDSRDSSPKLPKLRLKS